MKDIVITYNDNKKITIPDFINVVRYGIKEGAFFIEAEDGSFAYFPLINVKCFSSGLVFRSAI